MHSKFLPLALGFDLDIDRLNIEQLQGLTVPVRVTGPFDRLSYKIEFADVAEGARKAKVDEKKEELKQELKQRAREEVLKGLFGK